MQIISLDDHDFPAVLELAQGGQSVGRIWRNGRIQVVTVTPNFMFVCPERAPGRVALTPVRSLQEAVSMAHQFLHREEERGNRVERVEEM